VSNVVTDTESRAARRLKVLKTGKAVFNNGASVLSCTVRDLSETGAKLLFGEPLSNLPENFRLIFPQDNTSREARVMWRKGVSIGVQFTSDVKRAPPRKY
jgi:hypothetical protein